MTAGHSAQDLLQWQQRLAPKQVAGSWPEKTYKKQLWLCFRAGDFYFHCGSPRRASTDAAAQLTAGVSGKEIIWKNSGEPLVVSRTFAPFLNEDSVTLYDLLSLRSLRFTGVERDFCSMLLLQRLERQEIVARVCEQYEVAQDQVNRDLQAFVGHLVTHQVLAYAARQAA